MFSDVDDACTPDFWVSLVSFSSKSLMLTGTPALAERLRDRSESDSEARSASDIVFA
jgi:hypothetical protein